MSTRIEPEARYCASNYGPLPVVLTLRDGVYGCDKIDRAVTRIRAVIEEFDRLRLTS